MAALSGGGTNAQTVPVVKSVTAGNLIPTMAFSHYAGYNVMLSRAAGYSYLPPTVGQLYPRGDYTPNG
jgi:hypothetical protein